MSESTPHTERFMRDLIGVQDRLYAYAYTLLHDADAAEDVVQETNAVCWRKAAEYEPGTEFGAWACRIAYFEALKVRQRAGRDRLVFDDALLTTIADRSAQVTADVDDRRRALRACLGELSDDHRALLESRYEAGGSVGAIAERLGRPIKTVYQTLYRLRASLVGCVERRLGRETQA